MKEGSHCSGHKSESEGIKTIQYHVIHSTCGKEVKMNVGNCPVGDNTENGNGPAYNIGNRNGPGEWGQR